MLFRPQTTCMPFGVSLQTSLSSFRVCTATATNPVAALGVRYKHKATRLRANLHKFLGSKNFKGLYTRNPLAFTPVYGKFDSAAGYISNHPSLRRRLIDRKYLDVDAFYNTRPASEEPSTHPFPHNSFCVTNRLVPQRLKERIIKEHNQGESLQRISFKYSITLPRIEAIVKLNEIETKWQNEQKITVDLNKLDRVLTSMFPEIPIKESTAEPEGRGDNLTEIPIPSQTRHQRFLTIAENEPFGPLDASRILGIEPAADTLSKITTEHLNETENGTPESNSSSQSKATTVSFYAPVLEGEKTLYRFTAGKVGQVGHRYGASRDDRKHARKVKFTATGRMIYA